VKLKVIKDSMNRTNLLTDAQGHELETAQHLVPDAYLTGRIIITDTKHIIRLPLDPVTLQMLTTRVLCCSTEYFYLFLDEEFL
jgi:hypothetical protein